MVKYERNNCNQLRILLEHEPTIILCLQFQSCCNMFHRIHGSWDVVYINPSWSHQDDLGSGELTASLEATLKAGYTSYDI